MPRFDPERVYGRSTKICRSNGYSHDISHEHDVFRAIERIDPEAIVLATDQFVKLVQ
ncbi:MAG: hypothetical protein U1D69_00950 [Polynucleobacter sp.]|nr:hypothetical protein [Polynucleobacter sp.]